jgi:GTP cyclohydrolase I
MSQFANGLYHEAWKTEPPVFSDTPKGPPLTGTLPWLRAELRKRSDSRCEQCGDPEYSTDGDKGFVVHFVNSPSEDQKDPQKLLDKAQLICHRCHHAAHQVVDKLPDVSKAVAYLLSQLGAELNDPNFCETPRRFATYLMEHFLPATKVREEIELLQGAVFPSSAHDMVVEKSVRVNSLCPHHLLPIMYDVTIGYIPTGWVIGLSKLARIAEVVLVQPLVQENATVLLADTFEHLLHTTHVAVQLQGVHTCMTVRGVKQHDSVTLTSALRGEFLVNPSTRAEFLSIAKHVSPFNA